MLTNINLDISQNIVIIFYFLIFLFLRLISIIIKGFLTKNKWLKKTSLRDRYFFFLPESFKFHEYQPDFFFEPHNHLLESDSLFFKKKWKEIIKINTSSITFYIKKIINFLYHEASDILQAIDFFWFLYQDYLVFIFLNIIFYILWSFPIFVFFWFLYELYDYLTSRDSYIPAKTTNNNKNLKWFLLFLFFILLVFLNITIT